MQLFLHALFAAAMLLAFAGCGKKETGNPHPSKHAPPQVDLWKQFDGEKAMVHVKTLVEMGPRPAGSGTLEKSRQYLTTEFNKAGWHVVRQSFSSKTPVGDVEFVNLIARYGPEHDPKGSTPPPLKQRFIVASHYDTKRYDTISFVGANDGASSTGALVELARVLALDPGFASQVELVCFDGEEAFAQWTDTDSLYGSRFYAGNLRETGRAKDFAAGILWDMIGDKDFTLTLPPDSPPALAKRVFAAADQLGVRNQITFSNRPIMDDHVPINQTARIPMINLIDFDYPSWHTADDTLDKLSPTSLQTTGALTILTLVDLVRNGF